MASTYAEANITGYLGKDPELRVTQSGMAVANFSLAVNRKVNDQEVTDWIECTAFGKTAEVIEKYLRKARPVNVRGNIQQQTWKDQNTGSQRSKLFVLVNKINFIDSVGDSTPTQKADSDGFVNSPDSLDELPFV